MYWFLSRWKFKKSFRKVFVDKGWTNVLVLAIASVGVLLCFIKVSFIWPWLAGSVLLTLLYSVPLWPIKLSFRLDRIGSLKTFLLAAAWAYTTVFIPSGYLKIFDFSETGMLFLTRFLFMLMLCIMFDSRDAHIDRINSLKSLATDFSPAAVRKIMLITFSLYMITGILFRYTFQDVKQTIAFLIVGIVTFMVYWRSLKDKRYLFYYFVVDGLMLFSAVTAYLATIL